MKGTPCCITRLVPLAELHGCVGDWRRAGRWGGGGEDGGLGGGTFGVILEVRPYDLIILCNCFFSVNFQKLPMSAPMFGLYTSTGKKKAVYVLKQASKSGIIVKAVLQINKGNRNNFPYLIIKT